MLVHELCSRILGQTEDCRHGQWGFQSTRAVSLGVVKCFCIDSGCGFQHFTRSYSIPRLSRNLPAFLFVHCSTECTTSNSQHDFPDFSASVSDRHISTLKYHDRQFRADSRVGIDSILFLHVP